MMTNRTIDNKAFKESSILDIELDSGCLCAEIMPIIPDTGDSLAYIVESANEKPYGSVVNVLAGCEDGNVIITELNVPKYQDPFEEYKEPHDKDKIMNFKESIQMHKDAVTSISQRPKYPYQFLTTSLDGEATLSLLSSSLASSDLITEFSKLFSSYTN